jgi:hypothetical protein
MDAKHHAYFTGPPQQGVMYTVHVDKDIYKLFRPYYLERHGHTAWKRSAELNCDLSLFRNEPEVAWIIHLVDAWCAGIKHAEYRQRQRDWLDDDNVEKLQA